MEACLDTPFLKRRGAAGTHAVVLAVAPPSDRAAQTAGTKRGREERGEVGGEEDQEEEERGGGRRGG